MHSEKLSDSYSKSEKTLPLLYNQHEQASKSLVSQKKPKKKKKKFFCCCIPKKRNKNNSKSNDESFQKSNQNDYSLDPNLPGRRIAFDDLGSCPSWQNLLIGEFARLRDEKGYKWVTNLIGFLTSNYGPTYLKRPQVEEITEIDGMKIKRDSCLLLNKNFNYEFEDNNDNKNCKERVCYFQDKLKSEKVKRSKTLIKLNHRKVIERLTNTGISRLSTHLTSAFRNPRSSNLGLIWSSGLNPEVKQEGINLDEYKNFYEESGTKKSKLDSKFSIGRTFSKNTSNSQPHRNNLKQIEEYEMDQNSSINTYNDGKLFQFLNRESELDITVEAQGESEEVFYGMLKDCFLRVNFEFKKQEGYFFELFQKFIESVIYDFSKLKNKNLPMAVALLIEAVKIFSCFLSSSLFKMFQSFELITKKDSIKPEEVFISQIVSKIHCSKFPNLKVYPNFHALLTHYIKKMNKDELMSEFRKGKEGMMMTQGKLDILHFLLRLDNSSLDYASKIITGEVKTPEFVVEIKRKNSPKSKNMRKPYQRCLNILNHVKKVKSPYTKVFMMVDCLEKITAEVDLFYKENGFDVVFAVTGDELFPIIIYLLLNSESEEIVLDVFLASLFLTESMQLDQCGFCIQSFMAGIDFIGSNSFMNDMQEERGEDDDEGGGSFYLKGSNGFVI